MQQRLTLITNVMPTRLENCPIFDLPNPSKWKLQGHSKAGERTGFWLHPLNIVLDAGLATYRNPKCIFISHSHTDHTTRLPDIYTGRTQPAKGQEGLNGRPVIMPQACVPIIKKYLESIVDLAWGKLDACKEMAENEVCEAVSVWKIQSTYPMGVEVGQVITVPGLDKISVDILPCYHSVTSVGYGFSSISQKLKNEYRGLSGKEIGNLRKRGVEITADVEVPQIVFFGDTNIKALTLHQEWKRYPVIIIECTIYEDNPVKDKLEEHIAWFQMEKIIAENPDNHFVLIHSSMSTNEEWLTQFEKDKQKELHVNNFNII